MIKMSIINMTILFYYVTFYDDVVPIFLFKITFFVNLWQYFNGCYVNEDDTLTLL